MGNTESNTRKPNYKIYKITGTGVEGEV